MQALSLKEHEGILHNPIGYLSSAPAPWWSGVGSEFGYGESVGQLRTSSLEYPASGGQQTATKHVVRATEQGFEKGNMTHFTIFPGNLKTLANRENPLELQAAISGQSAPPAHLEFGFSQPVVCAKYPHGNQCYGVFSTYGPQGRIMLPLNLTKDDGPIYVNAKQYHGIIRRRLSRAKAESKNKVVRERKPYLHLSRHLHALRRPRGCGGRFLNSNTSLGGKGRIETEKTENYQLTHATNSQNSEVLQSESGNLNSSKVGNGSRSNLSGSEVTSMFSRRELDVCSANHLRSSIHSLTNMMNSGHRNVVLGKWAAAADSSRNLNL